MLHPRHRWVLPVTPVIDPELRAAAVSRGLSDRLISLLGARGVVSPADLDAWFAPPEAALHDPGLLPDAMRVRQRIAQARSRGERVMVFGDFDADGLTGLAILVRALRSLGLDVMPYVPSRLDEGHGLSTASVSAASDRGASLIVTVDCGSTSGPEIAAAGRLGIDVIVTDHHRVPATLPPALAIVNPHRPDATYPDRRLAGSGVAFKVASLLLGDEPNGPSLAASFADLAAVGTVADVAPIVGENRAIARMGLARLRSAPQPGLAALLGRAGIAAASVDLETVGFAIAPRLNAAGRIGEAGDAAALLLADDPTEAAALADRLEGVNATRRDVLRAALAEARDVLERAVSGDGAIRPAVVLRGPWPIGVVGLVAGRLAEESGRPAVVGAELGDVVRASCRSGGSMDLGLALDACADLFVRHGGHAGAAGFEIATDGWAAFETRFLALAADLPAPDAQSVLRIDVAVSASDVGYPLLRELATLAPFGPGHPDPLVAILGLTVMRTRVATGGHAQLVLRKERDVLDGIAFGWPELAEAVAEGDRVDIVGRLVSRTFAGNETLQIDVRDAAPAGTQTVPGASVPVLAGATG